MKISFHSKVLFFLLFFSSANDEYLFIYFFPLANLPSNEIFDFTNKRINRKEYPNSIQIIVFWECREDGKTVNGRVQPMKAKNEEKKKHTQLLKWNKWNWEMKRHMTIFVHKLNKFDNKSLWISFYSWNVTFVNIISCSSLHIK